MKRLIVGILWLMSHAAAAQSEHGLRLSLPLPGDDAPTLLMPGAFPGVADSVYTLSPARLRFYQRLHRHALDTTAGYLNRALFISYDRSLRNAQGAYARLWSEYHAADSLAAITLQYTQQSLAQLRGSLDHSQRTLAQTTERLRTLEAQWRRARRRARWRRLAFGAGGLGIGLLLGGVVW